MAANVAATAFLTDKRSSAKPRRYQLTDIHKKRTKAFDRGLIMQTNQLQGQVNAAAAVEAPVQEGPAPNEEPIPDPASAEDFALTLPDMSKVQPRPFHACLTPGIYDCMRTFHSVRVQKHSSNAEAACTSFRNEQMS